VLTPARTRPSLRARTSQLLYLPGQVIRAVPPIRRLVESILAEDEHGSSVAPRARSGAPEA